MRILVRGAVFLLSMVAGVQVSVSAVRAADKLVTYSTKDPFAGGEFARFLVSIEQPPEQKRQAARAPDANEETAFDATAQSIVGRMNQRARGSDDPLRLRTYPAVRVFGVTLSKSELDQVLKDDRVARVEPVRTAVSTDIATLNNDPYALKEFDRLKFTGKKQTIVVIDTGFNLEIPSIRKVVKDGSCISQNDPRLGIRSACPGGGEREMGLAALKACKLAGCDHGTRVVSQAAGVHGSGARKFAGAAPDARVYALAIGHLQCVDKPRAGKCRKEVFAMDSESVIDALYHMSNWGRHSKFHTNVAAVNLSIAVGEKDGVHNKYCVGEDDFTSYAYKIEQAIYLYKLYLEGALVIAAAGNNGGSADEKMNVPACLGNVISVGSVTKDFGMVRRSGWGDFVALGENVPVVTAKGVKTDSGTSFAAPQVAGFAARARQAFQKAKRERYLEIVGTRVQIRKRKSSEWDWKGAYQTVPRADATLAYATGEPFAVPGYIHKMDTDKDQYLIQCHYNVCLDGPDSKEDAKCYMMGASQSSLNRRLYVKGARGASAEVSAIPPIFPSFVVTSREDRVSHSSDEYFDKFNLGLVKSLGVGYNPITLRYRELSSYRRKTFDFEYHLYINDLSYTCDPSRWRSRSSGPALRAPQTPPAHAIDGGSTGDPPAPLQ